MPFCKYVFLGRTIQMLSGGGEQGRHVPIALKSSPKSGQNMAKKVLKSGARIFEKVLFPNRCS